MKKIIFGSANYEAELAALYDRPGYPPEIEEQAAAIIAEVKKDGDAALVRFAEKFDHVHLEPGTFKVTDEEIAEAEKSLSAHEKKCINTALKQVRTFAKMTVPKGWKKTVRPGVVLGEKFEPLDRVGVYIPGGTAPLVSTVIHTAGIASAAGVKEIAAVTPANREGCTVLRLLHSERKRYLKWKKSSAPAMPMLLRQRNFSMVMWRSIWLPDRQRSS